MTEPNNSPLLEPRIPDDPVIREAARRAFTDLTESYFAKAGDDPSTNRNLRNEMLTAVDKLGFCDVLNDPTDPDDSNHLAWSDAATIIREQALAGAPIDMVAVLVTNDRLKAIDQEPDQYHARASGRIRNPLGKIAVLTGLGRCLQLTCAMKAALSISLQYVQDRQQFGRPLAKFQAIQHALAVAAEETAAATAITDLSLSTLVGSGITDQFVEQMKAASIVASGAVSPVFHVTHQVHGAIGFTKEYPLHHHTINLLRWRDDLTAAIGTSIQCAEHLGTSAASEESVWAAVTKLMDSPAHV